MKSEELKAEASLAFNEWINLLRTSLEYKLRLGRQGSLRSSSILTKAVESTDFYVRYLQGSLQDSKRLFKEIYEQLENRFSDTPLNLVFANLTLLAKKSAKARMKISRILWRMLSALANKNAAALEAAFIDLIELAKSEMSFKS